MADYITKGSFNLGNQITLKNKNSNIDRDYGPYEGKTLEEIATLLTDTIQIGKTIGVIESGKVVEYWWQPEGDGYTFVKKGEGSEIVVDSELSFTSTNPIQNQAVADALDYKADSSTVRDIDNRVYALNITITSKAEQVDSIDTRVGTLETSITSKAEQSEVEALQAAVEGINTSIPMVVVRIVKDMYSISPNQYSILENNQGVQFDTVIRKVNSIETGGVLHYMIRFTNYSGYVEFRNWELQWAGGNEPEWEIGKTYEVSIIDNIALWAEIG